MKDINEQPMTMILDSLPDLVFVLDHTGKIINYRNSGVVPVFVAEKDFMQQDFRKFLSHSTRLNAERAFLKALETGQVSEVQYMRKLQNEKTSYYEARFSPFPDKSGAICLVRDITQQKETEESFHSLSDLNKLIVEFSSLLIRSSVEEIDESVNLTLQKLGVYSDVDRVYIFDYEEISDMINNTFEWCREGVSPQIENLQAVPFSVAPGWKEKFSAREHVYIPHVSEIDPVYSMEKETLEAQGITSLLAIPMFYGEKLIGFIGFDSVGKVREWTPDHIDLLRLAGEIIGGSIMRQKQELEMIEARKMAENANKAKSEFLASMSHEIRTPMNAILGFSEILYNNTNDERNRNYLTGIMTSGKTLLFLINDILDLSKIEAGKLDIVYEACRLRDIIGEIGKIFSADMEVKNLDFRMVIPGDFPEIIMVDDVRIRQILFNLVGNAVKFTPSGTIEVSVDHRPSALGKNMIDMDIRVKDTGIGIPASYHQSIFDAFVQVESNDTRKHGGTGLGLAITSKLASIMHGTISMESQVGSGSVFTVHLEGINCNYQETLRRPNYEWIDKLVEFEPATILVVDDVDFNRALARGYLSTLRFNVLEARNGHEGVQLARFHKPDLILMDIRMPMMNGFQALEALKSDPETRNIPCIAFTASSMKSDEEKLRKNFDNYLFKPLTRNDLIDCLMKHLPCRVAETSESMRPAFPANKNMAPFFTEQERPVLEALINELENEISADLKNLSHYMDIDLLNKLTARLKKISDKYDTEIFEPSLQSLKLSAENFDFDLFSRGIYTLTNLTENLKNQLKPHRS